jgi:hypothetical protein
MSMAAEEER